MRSSATASTSSPVNSAGALPTKKKSPKQQFLDYLAKSKPMKSSKKEQPVASRTRNALESGPVAGRTRARQDLQSLDGRKRKSKEESEKAPAKKK